MLLIQLQLYQQHLKTPIREKDDDTCEWVNYISEEEETEVRRNFNETAIKRYTEQLYYLRINQAMYNDKEFMALSDNMGDESDEEDPYEQYDRTTVPISQVDDSHNRNVDDGPQVYVTMEIDADRNDKDNRNVEIKYTPPKFRLARVDEDDLPFTDPMYIQYVNLEAANAATENEDSAPTHRRVHNLLTGVVEYEELVAVITRGGNGVRPK